MRVSYSQNTSTFIAHCDTSDERVLARKAGFIFNPLQSRFESAKLRAAAALRDHLDKNAENVISQVSCLVLSPWSGGLKIPRGKNLKLDKCQRQGVRFILERNHSYIAFEQGVGKTPTAIVAMNTLNCRTLVLCPPSLIPQWTREIAKWKTKHGLKFGTGLEFDVAIFADTRLEWLKDKDLSAFEFLIVDEAQRFVNLTAQRTDLLYGTAKTSGFVHRFPKVTLLSGTPMPNRPMELYPVLSKCAANVIDYRDQHEFGVRYCGGRETSFGWEYKGATNTGELRRLLHNVFMMRVEKDHTYAPKKRSIVLLNGRSKQILEYENAVLNGRTIQEFIASYKTPGNTREQDLGLIAKFRQAVAKRKVPLADDWVTGILDYTNESVLLLGWHTDAILEMAKRLRRFNPLVIYGKIPHQEKQRLVDRFQRRESPLMIANLLTMVGYNLDVATRAVVFEYSWTPKDNEQAEDRIHRRTSVEPVLMEYLVLQNTLDEYMMDTLFKKRKVIDKLITKHRE